MRITRRSGSKLSRSISSGATSVLQNHFVVILYFFFMNQTAMSTHDEAEWWIAQKVVIEKFFYVHILCVAEFRNRPFRCIDFNYRIDFVLFHTTINFTLERILSRKGYPDKGRLFNRFHVLFDLVLVHWT